MQLHFHNVYYSYVLKKLVGLDPLFIDRYKDSL